MSSYRLMFLGVRSSLVFSGFELKPPASGFQSYSYSSLKTSPSGAVAVEDTLGTSGLSSSASSNFCCCCCCCWMRLRSEWLSSALGAMGTSLAFSSTTAEGWFWVLHAIPWTEEPGRLQSRGLQRV